MTTVCLTSTCLPCKLKLGGHAWVYLNWARGCVLSGCDVILLEILPIGFDPQEALQTVRYLKGLLSLLQVPAKLCLVFSSGDERRFKSVASELQKETITLREAAEMSDILLNSLYTLPADVVNVFRRSALLDIDPGLLQVWMHEGELLVAKHDIYFTIGEKVGQPGSLTPDCGLHWIHTPPPVDLVSWPVSRSAVNAPYTTVTNWWGEWVRQGMEVFNNEKRSSFIEFRELPTRINASIELAISNGSILEDDRIDFETHGWRVCNSDDVSDTPQAYQNYIQRSRGEFSCAKPSCMKYQNAWISDRTLCYLASGKPAVVQHTGDSQFLPNGEGLFRFRTLIDAIHAFETIEADYETHANHARALAEEFFEAGRVVSRVLEQAL